MNKKHCLSPRKIVTYTKKPSKFLKISCILHHNLNEMTMNKKFNDWPHLDATAFELDRMV